MKNNNGPGVLVVALLLAIGGAAWLYYDAQKPKNKIQGNWMTTVDGAFVTMRFHDGQLYLSCRVPEGTLSVSGRYSFVTDNTMTIALKNATISDGTDSFAVSAAGLPIQAGRMTVVEVTDRSLVLRDALGVTVRFTKV